MARLRTLAEAIKTRLEEIPELAGKVIVYRRKNIESEFQRRMEKASGKAVVIRLISAKNQAKANQKPRFAGTYTVTLFSHPALTYKDTQALDELLEEKIAPALHGWWPEAIPSNGLIWCDTDTITFPDDPEFDVAVLTLQAPRTSS